MLQQQAPCLPGGHCTAPAPGPGSPCPAAAGCRRCSAGTHTQQCWHSRGFARGSLLLCEAGERTSFRAPAYPHHSIGTRLPLSQPSRHRQTPQAQRGTAGPACTAGQDRRTCSTNRASLAWLIELPKQQNLVSTCRQHGSRSTSGAASHSKQKASEWVGSQRPAASACRLACVARPAAARAGLGPAASLGAPPARRRARWGATPGSAQSGTRWGRRCLLCQRW